MRFQTIASLALIAESAHARLYSSDPVAQKSMFEGFKLEFERSYTTMDEETRRFNHFISNLKIADERNDEEIKAGGSAVHGITKFSDMSNEEFRRLLGADESMRSLDRKDREIAVVPPYTGSLSSVDWSGRLTTAVKDQGYCGSCWAFSATEQIESDAMRTLGSTYVLSPEQITQCDKTSYGCDGGWTEHAYNYVKGVKGLETEANYPYTSYQGVTGTCHSDSSKMVVGVSGYTTVSGETNMANYMLATGPLSVCVDASSWNSYTGGIMSSCGKRVDHCVQAVGVNTGSGGYWKVRNSWGTKWGESGYIRLAYGQNTCAITNDPTYVKVFKA